MNETKVSRAYIAVMATTESGEINATPANAAKTLMTA
jgi:hypothetical protein